MDDILLIDAAERFAKGEMSAEERIYFDDLRKNNASLDQAVVEQLFFLNQLNTYVDAKNFKTKLAAVEQKLVTDKIISRTHTMGNGKLIVLWHRYKKTIAVAASIAGLVSIFMASLVSSVNKPTTDTTLLVEKINEQANKTKNIEKKINELQKDVKAPAIASQNIDARFRATGFIIDVSNNYLVTNAHVVKEAINHLVVENSKGEQYMAKLVYVNVEQDLAIIKITDSTFKKLAPLPFSIRKNNVELGEQIFLMGFPKPELVYGEGYVSAKNGYKMDTVYCQISTAANEGNSGSPVITKNGELVGIITSSQTKANGVVFAIKSANIYKAITEVKQQNENNFVKISSQPSLKGLDRVSQVKKMQDYVFMIKGN